MTMSPAHRIQIIGAAGTGKTTLGKMLATELGVPHFDADDFFHLPTDPPFQQQRTDPEFNALLDREVASFESWVLTGGVRTWVPRAERAFSTIVFLYLPPDVRLERVLRREQERYGARIAAGGDMEESHRAFMKWAAGYDDSSAPGSNTLALHEERLRNATCPVLRLLGPLDRADAVRRVLEHVRK